MDLPTYTNIWRIEKRLYKLYDLRLPMPLPIVWIGVFVGVLVPWCVFLALVGLPFDAPWHVVYLVPPGVLTWLSTRPVIEGKRLTELLQSQIRYLFEPRTWCRMAPLSEPDEITFTVRVWRAAPPKAARAKATAEIADTAVRSRGGIGAITGRIAIKTAEPAGPAASERAADPIPPGVIRPAVAAAAAAAAPVVDAPPSRRSTSAPAAKETGTGERSAEAAREPAAEAGAPPIGTEALRRLRRLAASAEIGAVPPAEPASPDDSPTGHGGDPEQRADRAAAVIDEPSTAAAPDRSVREGHAPGGTEPYPPRPDAGEPTGADDPGSDRQTRPDTDDWQRMAREQHRKGRPPRPRPPMHTPRTAQTAPRAQTAPPVRPAQRPVRPVQPQRAGQPTAAAPDGSPPTQAAPAVRLVQPVPDSRVAEPAQADPAAARETPVERPKLRPPKPVREEPPKLRRVEAVVGRDPSGGWRRLAQVIVGAGRTDGMEVDEARARTPLSESKRIMVLGCTGGAGQTATALMLGHTLARYREDGVLALDANAGNNTLTTRIAAESPETLSSLLRGSDSLRGYLGMRAYTSRCESGLEVVGADTDDQAAQRLADRSFMADWRRTLSALDRHYRLTVIDPAAALAARLLPYTDQLVLVAPASDAAPEAIAMTYEWLDGHGCAELRRRAVMVINGVSRRSLHDVEQAEAVASGRCRAIVRVPWEDELAPGRPGPVDVNHLRAGGRRAYVALAGVIVSSLAANRSGDARDIRERAGEKAGE